MIIHSLIIIKFILLQAGMTYSIFGICGVKIETKKNIYTICCNANYGRILFCG